MDESGIETTETPLATTDDQSPDDNSQHVGAPDGQTASPSPTVGQASASVADDDGQSDLVADEDSPFDLRQRIRTAEHVLGTQAVSELLGAAMFPRSQRSIERYSQSGKLDAFFDENTRTYWITRASVLEFIDELKRNEVAQQSATDAQQPNVGDDVRRRRPMSATDGHEGAKVADDGGHSTPEAPPEAPPDGSFEVDQLKQTLKRKEQEIIDLTITNRAKDQFMSQAKEQFEEFLDRLTDSNKRVGELENENRALKELPPGPRGSDQEAFRESHNVKPGDN